MFFVGFLVSLILLYLTCLHWETIILHLNYTDIFIIGHTGCSQGSIRLQGNSTTSGLVEICHINVWGTVCSNSYWGHADAKVTCRQLGLPTTGASSLTVSAVPDGTRVIWFWNVECVGTESTLFNCRYNHTGNDFCYQSDAGVSCQDSKSYSFIKIYH